MEKSKERENHIPNAVFYDEKDEIWIVSFWEDTDKNILGGDCSIAMQKKDSKVLNIWFGGWFVTVGAYVKCSSNKSTIL